MTQQRQLGIEQKVLLKKLTQAKIIMEEKRQIWKVSIDDADRFNFQHSIGKVTQLEKKLWKFS